MQGQLKCPSLHNEVCGLLTNKAIIFRDQALVVEGDTVGFAPANYLAPKQLWRKLYRFDGQGNPVFMLVNYANDGSCGRPPKAMQHSLWPNMPVRVVDLVIHPSSMMEEQGCNPTLLWTEIDGGNGFMVIRECENKDALVLDAHDSKLVVAAKYKGSDSQLWMFMPQPRV